MTGKEGKKKVLVSPRLEKKRVEDQVLHLRTRYSICRQEMALENS